MPDLRECLFLVRLPRSSTVRSICSSCIPQCTSRKSVRVPYKVDKQGLNTLHCSPSFAKRSLACYIPVLFGHWGSGRRLGVIWLC